MRSSRECTPSVEEALEQTGMEAIECGTPVIAFRAGGIPDFVKPGLSGFLAETGNIRELALRIKEAPVGPPRPKGHARKRAGDGGGAVRPQATGGEMLGPVPGNLQSQPADRSILNRPDSIQ